MSESLSRRGFLAAAAALAGAVVQDTVKRASPAAPVYDPDRAGRPQAPVTAADNDARIQAIEKKLRCSCGCGLDIYTCRTTDFSCTYSPALHKEVLRLADQGKSAQQIINEFVAQYGEQALMAPPRKGFNLVGYLLPGTVILAAAVILLRVLRRWTRDAETAAPALDAPAVTATPAELEQLRRELERLPG